MSVTARDLPKNVYRNGPRYMAVCSVGKKKKYLGTFDTPEEAEARAKLFREYFPVTRQMKPNWKPGDEL